MPAFLRMYHTHCVKFLITCNIFDFRFRKLCNSMQHFRQNLPNRHPYMRLQNYTYHSFIFLRSRYDYKNDKKMAKMTYYVAKDFNWYVICKYFYIFSVYFSKFSNVFLPETCCNNSSRYSL